jgi:hypothetical protein
MLLDSRFHLISTNNTNKEIHLGCIIILALNYVYKILKIIYLSKNNLRYQKCEKYCCCCRTKTGMDFDLVFYLLPSQTY